LVTRSLKIYVLNPNLQAGEKCPFWPPCGRSCNHWLFYIRFHKQGQFTKWNEERLWTKCRHKLVFSIFQRVMCSAKILLAMIVSEIDVISTPL